MAGGWFQSRASKEEASLVSQGFSEMSLEDALRTLSEVVTGLESITSADDLSQVMGHGGYGLTLIQIISGCLEGQCKSPDVRVVNKKILWKNEGPIDNEGYQGWRFGQSS